jgi:hypothetical protein
VSARVSGDVDPGVAQPLALTGQSPPNSVAAIAFDPDDRYGSNALPSDHPHWMKDTLSISQRARALIAKLKPVVVRVITAWDHRVRSISITGRTLKVDASGSYRFD